MGELLWIKRFLLVLLPAFVVIAASQLVQDRGIDAALLHGMIWTPITAAVYVAALRYRRCKSCVDATQGPSA
ncbi:MAG: hypothetical protein WKF61_03610 [Luteimonas sp.]